MSLDSKRWNQRRFYLFIIDAGLGKDDVGWQLYVRTPLVGFTIERRWPSIEFTDHRRRNGLWLGLLMRWPIAECDPIYKWKWKKERYLP